MTGAASSTVLVIADFTVAGIAPYLEGGDAPHLKTALAPFDQVMPSLLNEDAPCWRSRPEFAFVWTRPEAAIRSFARALAHEPVALEDLLADVDQYVDGLKRAASRVTMLFVATWTWPSHDRGLGMLNWDPHIGPSYLLARLNLRLSEAAATDPRIRVLDAGRWTAHAGEAATSPKLWHMGKIAFGPAVLTEAARDLKAAIVAVRGGIRKLVVLDLDETLWGGVVGDLGWQNLRLGGHDPLGEAFVAFQRSLQRLTHRGIVLGIVSKNTEAIALEAIDSHPEMVLRRNDFAGWRINWDDKARNIADLAVELNLGLDSVVFIDDNPAERARVRAALPQVLVPEWPADKLLYEQALSQLSCFDALTLSAEDKARTRMYVSERERAAARETSQSMDDYLASLDLVVTGDLLGPANIARATQLLNKTNQMNLSTRRMPDAQFSDWSAEAGHRTLVFRVSDRFDDYGLTGIASLSVTGADAELVDFILSCRVMGRGVEEAIVAVVVQHARALGARRLSVTHKPTPKNGPCKVFLDERSQLARGADGATYTWDLDAEYSAPRHVTITTLAASSPVA